MRLTVIMIGLWCGVAAVAAHLLRGERVDLAAPALAAAPATPPAGAQAAALHWPDRAAFAVIGTRPLFTPGRRPPAGAAVPADAAAGPAPTLIGVFGPEDARAAMLRDGEGAVHRARRGETVDGWRVEAVGPRAARLRSGAAEREVRLGEQAAQDGPAAQRGPAAPARRDGDRARGLGDFHLDGLGDDYDD